VPPAAQPSRCDHLGDRVRSDHDRLGDREDPAQLVFEIEAAILLANAQYVVLRTSEPIVRARRSVERRLTAARPG
jgi:hypothetical protein